MGAWIEIEKETENSNLWWSLPSWERGLKYDTEDSLVHRHSVAPFVGAWIEITLTGYKKLEQQSRSLRGSVD